MTELANIEVRHVFAASADRVWAIVGTPDRVDWVPGVKSCHLEGDVRTFVMSGAGDLRERIIVRNDEERLLEYGVIESMPPLKHHKACIRLLQTAVGCEMVWTTEVSPAQVAPFIEERMQASIACLEGILKG